LQNLIFQGVKKLEKLPNTVFLKNLRVGDLSLGFKPLFVDNFPTFYFLERFIFHTNLFSKPYLNKKLESGLIGGLV